MVISSTITNSAGQHVVSVTTNGNQSALAILPKAQGQGSSINGGELLFLSLATCFCNDVYREAGKRGLVVHKVEVTVMGMFGKEGEPAANITYQVHVDADCTSAEKADLIAYVDQIAEVHNTLRKGVPVILQAK